MEQQAVAVISSSFSLASLLGVAYYAGSFTEKIKRLEEKVKLQAEVVNVDKDFEALQALLEKDLKSFSLQLEGIRKELEHVRSDFYSALRSPRFFPKPSLKE